MCMVGFKLIGRAGGCAVSLGVAVPYIGVMCSLSMSILLVLRWGIIDQATEHLRPQQGMSSKP